jgi:hypothetical protein
MDYQQAFQQLGQQIQLQSVEHHQLQVHLITPFLCQEGVVQQMLQEQ